LANGGTKGWERGERKILKERFERDIQNGYWLINWNLAQKFGHFEGKY
jgi:hypothetical protein